jgi:hypothetical protein
MEEVFYTGPNEYWQYYTGKSYGTEYFKFNNNKTIDYVDIEKGKFINTNSGQNIETGSLKWSVSKDSILTWDERKYDIVSYNDKLIILYIEGKNEPDNKMTWAYVYLVKGTIDNVRRFPGHYNYKRELYPEKYTKQ